MAKQKLGQHFLKDGTKAEKIADALLHHPGPVLEIGPGKGALTDILDRKAEGRTIITVEKDAGLIPDLESREYRNVRIVEADILKTDPKELFKKKPVNLLGNIPYLISKEILDWIIRHHSMFFAGVLMVQKEFYQKVTSGPGSKAYNPQSVMFGTLFETGKLFDVPPGSFAPPPKVTSTVFTFTKRGQVPLAENIPGFYTFLKTSFSHRRKTLVNNLSKDYSKDKIIEFLSRNSLPKNIRAEDMTPENFRELYSVIQTSD